MHADGDGLYLRVRPSGARSWVFLSVRRGKRRETGLGASTTVSLSEARMLASQARQTLEDDSKIESDRRSALGEAPSEVLTFAAFAADLIDNIELGFRSEKHRKQWRSTLATHAVHLSDIPVDLISTEAVLRVLKPIWVKIPETASRVRSRVERVLDAAKALGHRSGENPARWKGHLEFILPRKPKAAIKHHAALLYGAMSDFIRKLRRQEGIAAQALAFTILSVARSSETIGMRWGEVDPWEANLDNPRAAHQECDGSCCPS